MLSSKPIPPVASKALSVHFKHTITEASDPYFKLHPAALTRSHADASAILTAASAQNSSTLCNVNLSLALTNTLPCTGVSASPAATLTQQSIHTLHCKSQPRPDRTWYLADASASLTATSVQPSQALPCSSATSDHLQQRGTLLRRMASAQQQQQKQAPANLDLSRREAAKLQEAPGLVNAHDQWRMQQLLLYDV
eukprot:scaffold59239_cov21-Tisochrysis_lutea.AAC.2